MLSGLSEYIDNIALNIFGYIIILFKCIIIFINIKRIRSYTILYNK